MILILEKIFVWLSLFVAIPSFFYYQSYRLKEMVPFYFFEGFLFFIFIKVLYDIFDWYNDVWIISNKWIYDIKWKLFKTEVNSINYENIEWVESEQDGIIDMILNKGDIVIHKIWSDVFRIKDVSKPFVAINEIEHFTLYEEEKEEDTDKFEMIVEALSWVVWEYVDKNGLKKKDNEKEMFLEKIKWEEETIDLR